MDLFTYLLSKKGKNSLVHKGDLFAYLLGKKETPILPKEYQQVNYIKSTKTQYLLLDYNAKATSSYELTLKFDNVITNWTNSYRAFVSGRDFETSNSQYFQINFGSQSDEKQTIYVWINSAQTGTTAKKDVGNVIENKNTLIINNGQMNYGSFSSTTPTPSGEDSQNGFLLFAGRAVSTGNIPQIFEGYDMYVYNFKIYENNNLVMHCIPCYRKSDEKPGLYDIVNNVFYTNQGTGEFLYE